MDVSERVYFVYLQNLDMNIKSQKFSLTVESPLMHMETMIEYDTDSE